MAFSQVTRNLLIDSDHWAISLLLTNTYALGHTLVAIEGMMEGVRMHRVAHFVPYSPGTRPSMAELLAGRTSNFNTIKGQVKIKDSPRVTATVQDLVGATFAGKSWRILRPVAQRVLRRIHDDSLRGLDLKNAVPRYDFRMIGQVKNIFDVEVTSTLTGGINCANWSQAMLREAGVRDTGGLLIDFPRTQLLFGARSDWLIGFLIVIGAVDQLRQYLSQPSGLLGHT